MMIVEMCTRGIIKIRYTSSILAYPGEGGYEDATAF